MTLESDVLGFVAARCPKRVIVFDARERIVYRNPAAARFLERHDLPDDVRSLVRRLLAALAQGQAAAQLPGLLRLWREVGGRTWVFQLEYREGPEPLVGLYFSDETVSESVDLNALRERFRLTRRETDILRHVLDGLANQEVAEELGIATQTVKDHLTVVYGKIGVQDRRSLLRLLLVSRPPAPPLPR